jgi:hypothetical protein
MQCCAAALQNEPDWLAIWPGSETAPGVSKHNPVLKSFLYVPLTGFNMGRYDGLGAPDKTATARRCNAAMEVLSGALNADCPEGQ